ncbi:restriction endonuclease subunit S [Corynebacterium sp. MNWGS58]|uniref:restriction endonuclease subunit S n=1 Tax=Corynebacterium sp. 102791.4 TaxID=3104612 RepID=UPI0035153C7B
MPFITWLRSVNPDWNLVPANVLFAERSEKSGAEDVHLTPSQKLGVLPQAEYVERTGAQVVRNRTGAENMKHVEPGDFISHLRSFQGGLEYSALAGKVSNAYTVITPRVDLVDGYYRYLFKSSLFIEGLGNITDQLRDGQTINFARFSQFGLPLPPLETQRAIADYLDRETAEIDAMSADLDEMEALLTERRDAFVGSAVRSLRGLFTRASLQSIAQIHAGDTITAAEIKDQGAYPVYGGNGVRGYIDRFNESQDRVLVGRQGALCGNVHLASGPFFASEHALVVEPIIEVHPGWLAQVLKDQNLGQLSMSAAQPGITATGVGMQKIDMPPLDEQRRIADEIDRETDEIDSMLADITELRDLLAERRAAIIAAAVTGQIDIPIHEEATHA